MSFSGMGALIGVAAVLVIMVSCGVLIGIALWEGIRVNSLKARLDSLDSGVNELKEDVSDLEGRVLDLEPDELDDDDY